MRSTSHYALSMRPRYHWSLHSVIVRLGRSDSNWLNLRWWASLHHNSDLGSCSSGSPGSVQSLAHLGWCSLLVSQSIPNEIPQNIEAWTSVFWGVSFSTSRIGQYITAYYQNIQLHPDTASFSRKLFEVATLTLQIQLQRCVTAFSRNSNSPESHVNPNMKEMGFCSEK
jgi:hypothetical protein